MSRLQEITIANHTLPNGSTHTFHFTYQVVGQPLHSAPIVLVNHALTGNSEVAGDNGWWNSLVGYDKVIDLNRYTVIAFDIPGNGYNKQQAHLIEDYKAITTKVVAEVFWKALDRLHIDHLYAIIGGSLGGSIAWEMTFIRPQVVDHLIPIATSCKASDWLIGNALIQDSILNNSSQPIEDARMHAMLLYRTPASLQQKFANGYKESENQYAIESWLKYHGQTLNGRFTLQAYKLMNHLLKTIGQEVTEESLKAFGQHTNAKIHCIAVDTDYMFTKVEQEYTVALLKDNCKHITYQEIQSIHGHDAFLIEYEQLNNLLKPLF